MKKRIMVFISAFVLMGSIPNKVVASELFNEVWDEYAEDEQFQMMLEDYGEEYAIEFVNDVIANREQDTFENNIANSLTNSRPIVLHARTEYLTYYGGKSSGHYLSLDYVNRTSDLVRIVDCNYNGTYYGIHTNVSLSEAYAAISASGRYYIY
ncbi:MAG: hypothetical protein MR355_02865 [Lachnospiraceae bacterium]|nr:hypothetical protein [Lachnospiraceae bacterium]